MCVVCHVLFVLYNFSFGSKQAASSGARGMEKSFYLTVKLDSKGEGNISRKISEEHKDRVHNI